MNPKKEPEEYAGVRKSPDNQRNNWKENLFGENLKQEVLQIALDIWG